MTVLFGMDSVSMVPIRAHFAVGSHVAVRYLSRATGKVVTRSEYDQYKAKGIALFTVFEDAADNALRGYDQGKADAEWCVRQATDILGPPPASWVLPAAVDFDPTGREKSTDGYFEGWSSVRPRELSGPYGGYTMVAHSHARGFKGLYQTYAWSGGRFFEGVQAFQYSNDHFVGGVGVDFDKFFPNWAGNFGQYNPPRGVVPPHPLHYERFFPNELPVVQPYDKARKTPALHVKQLRTLRLKLAELALDVYEEAHDSASPPAWGMFHAGWRYQQLIHRSQGKKITA